MEKVITLDLGGETRSLDFTREGLFEHIQDATGVDPFEWFKRFEPKENGQATTNIVTSMQDASVIAYAGLNSYQDVKDLDPIPLAQVKRWMRSIPTAEVGKTLSALYDGLLSSLGAKEESPNPEAPLQSGTI